MTLPFPTDDKSVPMRLFGYPEGPEPRTVFLHGVLGSTAMWKAVATAEPVHRSVALPLPGHYPWTLDGSETASVLDGFAFLEAYRKAIGSVTTRPVQLVAHSTGALVALKFAALYPEMVSRLVLAGSFPCGQAAVRRSAMAMGVLLPLLGSQLFHALYRYWLYSPKTFAHGLATAKMPESPYAASTPARCEHEMLCDLRRSDPEALRQVIGWLGRTSLLDDLDRIEVPVTVLVSQDDPVVDAAAQLELAAALPVANAALLRCGHLPMLESPDLMHRLVFAEAGTPSAPAAGAEVAIPA